MPATYVVATGSGSGLNQVRKGMGFRLAINITLIKEDDQHAEGIYVANPHER